MGANLKAGRILRGNVFGVLIRFNLYLSFNSIIIRRLIMSQKCPTCGNFSAIYFVCNKCGAKSCNCGPCQVKRFGKSIAAGSTCPVCKKGKIERIVVK